MTVERNTDRAEEELSRFVARRHEQRIKTEGGGRPKRPAWGKGEWARERDRRDTNRLEWGAYHREQAERHRRILQGLIAEHEARGQKLLGDRSGSEEPA